MNDKRRAIYTHGYHESVLRSHRRRTAENSAGYLLPYLVPGLSVLDVGCGSRDDHRRPRRSGRAGIRDRRRANR